MSEESLLYVAGRQVSRSLKLYNLDVVSQRCVTLFNRNVIGDR